MYNTGDIKYKYLLEQNYNAYCNFHSIFESLNIKKYIIRSVYFFYKLHFFINYKSKSKYL